MWQNLNITVSVRDQLGKQHYEFCEQGIYFRAWILTIVRRTGKWKPAVRRKRWSREERQDRLELTSPFWSSFPVLFHTHTNLRRNMADISLLTQISHKLSFWLESDKKRDSGKHDFQLNQLLDRKADIYIH